MTRLPFPDAPADNEVFYVGDGARFLEVSIDLNPKLPASRRLTDGTWAAIGVKILNLAFKAPTLRERAIYLAEAVRALAPRRIP
jgi:hypothetical protein